MSLRVAQFKRFDYDRALQLIINYYTIRAENKDIIKELTPKAVKHILDSCVSIILPKKDKLGRAIFYLRPAKWDPDKFSLFEILRVNIMNLEMAIMEEENQINGMVLVINSSEMTWNHVKNFERGYAKIMMGIIQVKYFYSVIS
ncbi:hypothetical protein CAPTEDRAFT_204281 [Capitella teleta]|uniref:CRAL-TRIO domain-containing protein n=1 Tax=Capitella teleta TaxID=283909 RepID=R7U753_CAPTE|nr:hypothetical protein CAPTEDRAFT_204281 [Capitella teleta]|eukprot:ELU01941.1 hypothetical protein CAPTEDRAFT_204281 [Capitella teleta]